MLYPLDPTRDATPPTSGREPRRRRIGILLFDGVKTLDFVGPAEVFVEANQRVDGYELVLVSPDGKDITTSIGTTVGVQSAADVVTDLDTLMVPGSEQHPDVFASPTVLDAAEHLVGVSRRIASICSGAFVLASLGVLDGRSATTHWKFTGDLRRRYPAIDVQPDSIFVRDGNVYSSAGVAAGIDLALSLVEEDHGADVAREVAQLLLVYMQRSGGQSQFSASLRTPPPRTPAVREIARYVNEDPARPTSLRDLASHVNLSQRHLTRLFRDEMDISPIDYVHSLRFDLATRSLETGATVGEAAESAGFSSVESLRRAFLARLNVTPSAYQQRFRTTRG